MNRDPQMQLFEAPARASENVRCPRCHRIGKCDESEHEQHTLRALERARRYAFESQELERWDGLS